MAAEVNGIYSNQYGQQPAELAASTPAHSHAPSHSVASTTASAAQQKPDPREVGWLFVEQYYTTLSKTPEKIHLFYSKRSQMVHGMEAEKVLPAVGGKAISEKIKELDIQDCKVRVLNVDSQSSFQNIVVQVIGEISNKSEPHNKFVQTFVLAEQPGGYFVLNDIFRYLNNDDNEIVDDTVEPEFSTEEMTAEPTAEEEDTMETATSDVAVEAIDAKLEESELNEQEAEESATPDAETREDQFSTSAETVETSKDLLEQPSADILAEEKPAEPEPTPSQSPPRAATPTPAVEAPPAKKTWANMVGTKAPTLPAMPAPPPAVPSQPRAYRSSQPAAPAKLPTESGATPIPSPAPASTSPTESNGWQNVDNTKKQSKPQSKAASDQITLAYIKNVNEKVDARILREVLERYGELKYFDVSRPRNCAFVEFAEPSGYAAAVVNNPHDIGGETIYVEERRPRPNAYGGSNTGFARGGNLSSPARGRGDATRGRGQNMQVRSGSQGGGYSKENSRGGFQPRGTKPGNITPRGRGQPQAA